MDIKKQLVIASLLSTTAVLGGCDLSEKKATQPVAGNAEILYGEICKAIDQFNDAFNKKRALESKKRPLTRAEQDEVDDEIHKTTDQVNDAATKIEVLERKKRLLTIAEQDEVDDKLMRRSERIEKENNSKLD
ncbi:MAG: hypothetical protein EU981_02115 [Candidatus Liberibacter ctenarytainae]|uniref:Lipoprotein n=1 Tax=Candidatus Liberibacter ctenarytainae TaxID=2020335 RepID=A0A937AEG5_9HYPH|nr:hypothetical protein [Candidatus Liberibacter ctenarytainae]